MPKQRLILASSSLARRTSLEQLLIPFEWISPNIDETPLPDEAPTNLVERLTREKGRAAAKSYPEAFIISADQVIVVNGEAISKPEAYENAVHQLEMESGQWVEALSGIGLLNARTNQYHYACVITRVLFKHITREQIEKYLAKDPQALHCAGSLRVEASGISLLEKVHSDDPSALIGLPLIALCDMLAKEGFDVLR